MLNVGGPGRKNEDNKYEGMSGALYDSFEDMLRADDGPIWTAYCPYCRSRRVPSSIQHDWPTPPVSKLVRQHLLERHKKQIFAEMLISKTINVG